MTMEIRQANEADADAIARMEATCFPDPWSRSAVLSHLQNTATLTYLATADGVPVGALLLLNTPPVGEVLRVMVLPQARRQGIATALLRYGEGELVLRGNRRMYLEVRAGNLGARALYRACGFGDTGTRPHYYHNPREDAVVMEKRIGHAVPRNRKFL